MRLQAGKAARKPLQPFRWEMMWPEAGQVKMRGQI